MSHCHAWGTYEEIRNHTSPNIPLSNVQPYVSECALLQNTKRRMSKNGILTSHTLQKGVTAEQPEFAPEWRHFSAQGIIGLDGLIQLFLKFTASSSGTLRLLVALLHLYLQLPCSQICFLTLQCGWRQSEFSVSWRRHRTTNALHESFIPGPYTAPSVFVHPLSDSSVPLVSCPSAAWPWQSPVSPWWKNEFKIHLSLQPNLN